MTIRMMTLISAAALLAACSASADGAKKETAQLKQTAEAVVTKVAANDLSLIHI